MKTRNLGRSDLKVSIVGLGCNNFGMRTDLRESRAVIDAAIDRGITLFDTADIYGNRGGSETILGQVLGDRRKSIVLATKVGKDMDDSGRMKGSSRRYIMSGIEASLRRLRTDYVDLYQIHEWDPLTPLEETMRALDDLVRQGKVRYLGCSNYPASQVVEAHAIAGDLKLQGFISCQDQYSLLARAIEKELIPVIEDKGMALLPFFPLAGGLLSGKYKRHEPPAAETRFAAWKALAERYLNDRNWGIVERLDKFCAERGRSLLELAFSWLLARPVVASVIAGATKPEQIAQNVVAANWALSPEDLDEIDTLTS